jgi:hypothetical protein
MRKLCSGVSVGVAALVSSPAYSQMSDRQFEFVQANIIGIFYHELGHAVIHTEEIPIFGQEEDAADVLSALLIHETFIEADAQAIAFDAAFGYLNDPAGMEEVVYWDNHGPDAQRFYNHVCIFYGAAPEERRELADDLGLPEERAGWCPTEFEQASKSWGPILEEMSARAPRETLNLVPGTGGRVDILYEIVADEVKDFNENFTLSNPVDVKVEPCGQANAFYDRGNTTLTMCTEFVDHLLELQRKLNSD